MPQARIYSLIFILVIATSCATNRAAQVTQQTSTPTPQPATKRDAPLISNQSNGNAPPKISETLFDKTPETDEERAQLLNKRLPEKARQFLESAEEFELISLDSRRVYKKEKVNEETLSGGDRDVKYVVCNKRVIAEPNLRKHILESLYNGVSESGSSGSLCFYPRHAIRAKSKGKTLELVICFQCVNFNGQLPDGKRLFGGITKTPQEFFDKALSGADLSTTP